MDGPAASAHQRGLDEIVAHDVAAERLAPRQFRQAGLLGEGAGADQRVVAPVVALRAVPPGDAVGDDRAVDAAGELLHPGEQRRAAGDDRQGLDQADVGMRLHGAHQRDERFAAHDAVGVQDEELRIGVAEAADPFGDVAGLAGGVPGAMAVEDPGVAVGSRAQVEEGFLLGDPGFGVSGVAQDEDVEQGACLKRSQGLVDGFQAGHDAGGRFVVGRHQQRGAGGRQGSGRQQATAAAAEDRGEAGDGAGEGQGDPGEQSHEQRQHDDRQRRGSVDREDTVHFPRAEAGQHDRAADHRETPPCHPGWRGGWAPAAGWRLAQRLRRHRQRRLGRQGAEGQPCVHR